MGDVGVMDFLSWVGYLMILIMALHLLNMDAVLTFLVRVLG